MSALPFLIFNYTFQLVEKLSLDNIILPRWAARNLVVVLFYFVVGTPVTCSCLCCLRWRQHRKTAKGAIIWLPSDRGDTRQTVGSHGSWTALHGTDQVRCYFCEENLDHELCTSPWSVILNNGNYHSLLRFKTWKWVEITLLYYSLYGRFSIGASNKWDI